MRIFNTNINPQHIHILLLILRASIGCLMLVHGIPKLEKLMADGEIKFGDPLGVGAHASLVLTVFAEVVCSLFILIGLATRLAVIPLIITMLVAVIIVHGSDPFGKQEPGLHYLLVYIVLLIAGSGKYSVDNLIQAKRNKI